MSSIDDKYWDIAFAAYVTEPPPDGYQDWDEPELIQWITKHAWAEICNYSSHQLLVLITNLHDYIEIIMEE